MEEMHRYIYDGPVMAFNTCIATRWRGETLAVSEGKAKSNLAYQFKKNSNRTAGTNIVLPGKVKRIN